MSGQQKSVVYGFNIYMLTESRRVNIMKRYTRNLNSYNKGAATMFLRGLRANPTSLFLDFEYIRNAYELFLNNVLFELDGELMSKLLLF